MQQFIPYKVITISIVSELQLQEQVHRKTVDYLHGTSEATQPQKAFGYDQGLIKNC